MLSQQASALEEQREVVVLPDARFGHRGDLSVDEVDGERSAHAVRGVRPAPVERERVMEADLARAFFGGFSRRKLPGSPRFCPGLSPPFSHGFAVATARVLREMGPHAPLPWSPICAFLAEQLGFGTPEPLQFALAFLRYPPTCRSGGGSGRRWVDTDSQTEA